MDLVLGLFVIAMYPLAMVAVVSPPVAVLTCRRRVVPALLLYVSALGMLVAWIAALNANMDWADRTGGGGSAVAGAGWWFGAMAATLAASYLTIARPGTVSTA